MMIKWTIQGALIYATLVCYLVALLARCVAWRRTAKILYTVGFAVAVASVAWRGVHSGHPPMQNLFEFFLCMAAMLPVLTWLSARRQTLDTLAQDSVLGVIILIPAGFVFDEALRRLMPALQSPLFVPHVASYVLGYLLLARAACMTLPVFRAATPRSAVMVRDFSAWQTAAVGFFLVTVGLVLGAIWGKWCWGHYWQWDPKEMWSLATWMIYGGYFHFRRRFGMQHIRWNAAWLWLGLLFVVLTLTWINVSRLFAGMHNYA